MVLQPYSELLRWMGAAWAGLHTMWNEHFGISVVEMLAAGLAVIAHRSGGPRMDIIQEGQNGYLAETAEEYADRMRDILDNFNSEELDRLRERGRLSSNRFSDEVFMQLVVFEVEKVLALLHR